MGVTISDVAKAAGVSASTVSRAISRPDKVDEATRSRIFEQVDRLGYKLNRAASGLVTGRTGNIGVIVSDLANPFFPDIVKGAQRQAHQHDFTTLLADSGEDPAAEATLVGALSPQVDGIVVCGSRLSDEELQALPVTVPLVLVNRTVAGIPSIPVDNAGGMRQAVRHLRALRHRRIGYLGGPQASRSHQARIAGARDAAAEAGLELVELGSVEPTFAGGASAADTVLLAEVTAVLAYNDVIAIGLMHRLADYGIAIPDEISVIGFDDIPLAEMTYPPLTTVCFPRREAGEAAVELLRRILDDPDNQNDTVPDLSTELVIRRSTRRITAVTPTLQEDSDA
ncbi:LacI family DNA-binding transcriptional regulator [Gordonia sp. NPDC003424]